MQNKVAIALISFFSFFSCANTKHRITLDQFDKIVAQENVQIVDLRTPGEVKSTGVIKNAQVKNYFDSDFNDFVSSLDKSKQYVIYCRSGGRSSRAINNFLKAGLKVHELGMGINGWQEKGRPLVKN